MAAQPSAKSAQVFDIFSGKMLDKGYDKRIVRFTPEFDNLCMLYGNDSNPGKLYSMKIIAWGLQANGETVGLVPWLNRIMPCPELTDPLNGHWEGYYEADSANVFYEAPDHKRQELEGGNQFYPSPERLSNKVVQEIPDVIGTHAVMADHSNKKFIVHEVFSWRLTARGDILGMCIDQERVVNTPVLVGDSSLYPAQNENNFKYFFQYKIANKLKEDDPEALDAIAHLIDF